MEMYKYLCSKTIWINMLERKNATLVLLYIFKKEMLHIIQSLILFLFWFIANLFFLEFFNVL